MNEPKTMDELTVTENFPDVKPNAIEAVQKSKDDANKQHLQNGFDPKIHAHKDGTPILSKSGQFQKQRGRKAGTKIEKNTQSVLFNPTEEKPKVSSRYSATVVSGVIEALSVKLVSDEFILTKDEREKNVTAWEQCFDYYGGVNLTPPQALAIDHLNIIMTRSMQPKTQSKFTLFKAFVKDKIQNMKFKKVKENALSNNRADSIGQDDVGEKESPQPEKIG